MIVGRSSALAQLSAALLVFALSGVTQFIPHEEREHLCNCAHAPDLPCGCVKCLAASERKRQRAKAQHPCCGARQGKARRTAAPLLPGVDLVGGRCGAEDEVTRAQTTTRDPFPVPPAGPRVAPPRATPAHGPPDGRALARPYVPETPPPNLA